VWRWLVFVAACGSTPDAPKPTVTSPLPTPKPTPAVATSPPIAAPHTTCIRDDIELAVDNGRAVLCWPDGCERYEAGKPPAVVARPPRLMFHPDAEVREDQGHLAACNPQGCVPLGGKLAKLIADIRAFQASEKPGDGRDGPLMPVVTRDRALVYLSGTKMGPHLWNVADDKPIEPQQPSSLHRFAEAHVVAAQPAGDAMVVMWSACRTLDALGSCGMDAVYRMTLVDARGHDLDGEHNELETVLHPAPDRYLASGDTVQLIEHGKVVASRAFTVAASSYSSKPSTQIVGLDDDHVALLFHGADGWRLLAVTLAKGLPDVELARPAECPI
jgi:hypothetical protein